jgi:esterase/lipase superfamily enzyme
MTGRNSDPASSAAALPSTEPSHVFAQQFCGLTVHHRQHILARWTAVIGVTFVLAQCTSRPEGMLVTVEAPQNTERVDILAATTRARSDQPGIVFSGDRDTEVHFVNVVMSIPRDRTIGTVQWPHTVPGNPRTDFVATAVTPVADSKLLDWFHAARGKKRRVFLFVHGFNTRFDTAVFRFGQLAHDADADAAPVLFSWPSRGRLFDYRLDLDNATYSRSDLAHLIRTAATSTSVAEITILAHSMGTWVAVEALRQLALEDGALSAKIKNVILASPDLDIGVFRKQIEDIGPHRPQITLFVSRNDMALQLSRLVSAGVTRLGAIDLRSEDYLNQLHDLRGITVIDLSAVQSGDRINHDIYATSPGIVRLIGDRLIQGQIVTDSDVSSPSVTADTIGSAAGLAVATPILLFQSATARLAK